MVSWLHRKRDDGTEAAYCPECECEVDPSVTFCKACGYDIVKQARVDMTQQPRLP